MNQPLADRLRPKSLDEIAGQEHLVGPKGILRRMLEGGHISNMIFSGPPGTGKTTVANIIAKKSGLFMCRLNATTASLSDVKEAISQTDNLFGAKGILLYLDEIQYFNRKQQQSLLSYMEDGRVTLIASTTENPYMSIYNAVLSRSTVFTFKPVPPQACIGVLRRALQTLDEEYGTKTEAEDEVLITIAKRCGGDVRSAVSVCEQAYFTGEGKLTEETINTLTPTIAGGFDKVGDVHYDLLSCLQKSIRGSDPDAAVFYLAKLLAGGDLLSPCRRLQVIASEDIGAAWPLASVIVRACVESAKDLGLPEAAIPLANAVVSLATAPKSNSAYLAYDAALSDINAGKGAFPPNHLRSPLFNGYLYPHNYPNHYVRQQYLPDDLKDKTYYRFGDNKTEQTAKMYYDFIRGAVKPEKKDE